MTPTFKAPSASSNREVRLREPARTSVTDASGCAALERTHAQARTRHTTQACSLTHSQTNALTNTLSHSHHHQCTDMHAHTQSHTPLRRCCRTRRAGNTMLFLRHWALRSPWPQVTRIGPVRGRAPAKVQSRDARPPLRGQILTSIGAPGVAGESGALTWPPRLQLRRPPRVQLVTRPPRLQLVRRTHVHARTYASAQARMHIANDHARTLHKRTCALARLHTGGDVNIANNKIKFNRK